MNIAFLSINSSRRRAQKNCSGGRQLDKKFDPNGDYVRRWCPELARLPNEHIHTPFAAAPAVLDRAGVRLGQNYPLPIVDLDRARKAALDGYGKVGGARN